MILQLHLFGFVEEPNWEVEVPNIPPMPQSKQLELEKELLGMYISGHPLDAYAEQLSEMEAAMLHQLAELPDNSEVLVAGMILSNKTIVTKKGQPMAFMELEDRIDKVEVVLFPETWKNAGSARAEGQTRPRPGEAAASGRGPAQAARGAACRAGRPRRRPAASPAARGAQAIS